MELLDVVSEPSEADDGGQRILVLTAISESYSLDSLEREDGVQLTEED